MQKHPKYRKTWERSFANELGRLTQGIRDIKGTSTLFFIPKNDVPPDRKVTYGRIVCELRPMKKEVERTRLTVGGNLLEYPDNLRTETADILTFKLLINSTISTPGARFICLDVKNFYLNTPMKRPEYMRLPIELIPQEIIEKMIDGRMRKYFEEICLVEQVFVIDGETKIKDVIKAAECL